MLFNAVLLLAAFVQLEFYVSGIPITSGPVVSLDYATFEGASLGGVDTFLGIPYAQPPAGNLRFRPPQPPLPLSGNIPVSETLLFCASLQRWAYLTGVCVHDFYQALSFGDSCFQQNYTLPYIPGLNYSVLAGFASKANQSEDCTLLTDLLIYV